VVVELKSEPAELGADLVEFFADLGAGGAGAEELPLIRRADDVAGAEQVGFVGDFAQVGAEGGDANVLPGDFQARVGEGLGGADGVEVTISSGFDSGVTDFGDFGDRGCEIVFYKVAEGPQLK